MTKNRGDETAEPEGGRPRIQTAEELPGGRIGPGITYRPVFGESVMLNYVSFAPHTGLREHRHPEEQLGTVLEGELEFRMGGEIRLLGPGDAWVVPPDVPHAARTLEKPCVVLDVFSPPRAVFRDLLDGEG